MSQADLIDNLALIENGLLHIRAELGRRERSYFRIAREAHLVLYRSMIEALRGTANLSVTRPWRGTKRGSYQYQLGTQPWQEIHAEPKPEGAKRWRFSNPQPCDPPQAILDESEELRQIEPESDLISFFEALAMVQAEAFMSRHVGSKPVAVSDEEMRDLEWLNDDVRNVYEHFVPKSYLAGVPALLSAGLLCLGLSTRILFESGNVAWMSPQDRLRRLFTEVEAALRQAGSKSDVNPAPFRHVHSPWLLGYARQLAYECLDSKDPWPPIQPGVTAILMAAIAVEAFFNELAAEVERFKGRDSTLAILRDALTVAEEGRATTQLKFIVAGFAVGKPVDRGAEPFQSLDLLMAVRNEIAHMHSHETRFMAGRVEAEPQGLLKRLRARHLIGEPSQRPLKGFIEVIGTADLAEWSVKTALDVEEYVVAGVADPHSNRFLRFHFSVNQPL